MNKKEVSEIKKMCIRDSLPLIFFQSAEQDPKGKHRGNSLGKDVYKRQALACSYPTLENPRWHAIKLLEKDESVTAAFPLPDLEKIIDLSLIHI